jgi:hypothetical protein
VDGEDVPVIPYDQDRVAAMLSRLWKACERLPDLGDDLWARGVEKIQEKYGCVVWLDKFEPVGMTEGEQPESMVTIEVNDGDS